VPPWAKIWGLFGKPARIDGLWVDEQTGQIVAVTEQAMAIAIQRHASHADPPLSYEAVVAVQLVAREGGRVAVQLDRQAACSFILMVPTTRSNVADRALRSSGLRRVLGAGVPGYEEWAWW
jgi:hypothetical protein